MDGWLKKNFDFVLRWKNINGEEKRKKKKKIMIKVGLDFGSGSGSSLGRIVMA